MCETVLPTDDRVPTDISTGIPFTGVYSLVVDAVSDSLPATICFNPVSSIVACAVKAAVQTANQNEGLLSFYDVADSG